MRAAYYTTHYITGVRHLSYRRSSLDFFRQWAYNSSLPKSELVCGEIFLFPFSSVLVWPVYRRGTLFFITKTLVITTELGTTSGANHREGSQRESHYLNSKWRCLSLSNIFDPPVSRFFGRSSCQSKIWPSQKKKKKTHLGESLYMSPTGTHKRKHEFFLSV